MIRGRVDALVACDDRTTGVVDFKTVEAKDQHLAIYARQLHAYALALEHPAAGPPATVSSLGLLAFSPERFEVDGSEAALTGGLTWTEVPLDRLGFMGFLRQVVAVLDQPQAPEPSSSCPWCPPGRPRERRLTVMRNLIGQFLLSLGHPSLANTFCLSMYFLRARWPHRALLDDWPEDLVRWANGGLQTIPTLCPWDGPCWSWRRVRQTQDNEMPPPEHPPMPATPPRWCARRPSNLGPARSRTPSWLTGWLRTGTGASLCGAT